MPRYHLVLRTQPTWAPLETLARLLAGRVDLPDLHPRDFMYMGCLAAAGRPVIHLYKHVDTRRYLPLDEAGHAYRLRWSVTAPGRATVARAESAPHRSLADAITFVVGHAITR